MTAILVETANIREAQVAEAAAPPGRYEVMLSDFNPYSQADLAAIRDYFVTNGVEVTGIRQELKGLYQLRIQYVKHAPSEGISQGALLIPLIPPILLATLVGITIFRLEAVSASVTKVLVVAGAIAITLALILRQPAKEVAIAYRKEVKRD